MNAIDSFLSNLFDSPLMHQSVFVLFSVIAIGLLVGRVKLWGVSLGSASVMFVALVYGHYGVTLSPAVTSVGLVVFVYCIGIGAGSRFFSTLKKSGIKLAILSCAVVFVGGLVTGVVSGLFGLSPSVAAGVFAGALTSTPGLAAAQEQFVSHQDLGLVSAGYAIAYPFGVVGTVLFVQLWPRLRKKNLQEIGEELDAQESKSNQIQSILVKITNPKFDGRKIDDLKIIDHLRCRITRVMKDGILVPIEADTRLEMNQLVWVVGRDESIDAMLDVLGEKADGPVVINSDMDRRTLLVTNREFAGKTFSELRLLRKYGVLVSRVKRGEYEMIPDDSTEVLLGDQFVAVGNAENLTAFAEAVGHRPGSMGMTDLLSLTLGMALGVLVGSISFGGFKLGLAGGPLLVSLLLGHFGRVGVIAGYVPRPTRQLLGELGLCFFLAGAGIKGGASFIETLSAQGGGIFIVGMIATMAPIVVGYFLATVIFKFDILSSLGGVCGAMTSTPALGAISSKTDAQAPILSYASAYPAALLSIVLVVNMLLEIMEMF